MRDRDFLTKVYKHFSDFTAEASARELENFITDSRYTTSFNERIKEMMEEIKLQSNVESEIIIIFNTEGEIAIIDSDIIGKFIGDNYNLSLERYYKNTNLNKIVKMVVNGNEKIQHDFLRISYKVIFDTLKIIYSEIKSRKELLQKYKDYYSIYEMKKEDIVAIIACLLILEDICKYMSINKSVLLTNINKMIEENL